MKRACLKAGDPEVAEQPSLGFTSTYIPAPTALSTIMTNMMGNIIACEIIP
jgi:hypothetical protein